MKRLLLLLSFISLQSIYTNAFAAGEVVADTTILSFSDNAINKRITVISTGNKDFDIPVSFNLREILIELGLNQEEVQNIIDKISNEQYQSDTLSIVSPSGQKLQIVGMAPPNQKYSNNEEYLEENEWESENDPQNSPPEETPKFFPKSDFGFYLGLNNYRNAATSDLNKLRAWKSRYIAFSFRKNATLAKSKNLDLAFSYGPEFAIYNFMFENSNSLFNQNGQTSFYALDFSTKKSKLTVPYINLPVLLSLGTKKKGFKVSLGAYAGYRIGSHTKTKDNDGNKEKTRDGFNLNRFNYGLTSEIGKKGGLSFFFRYDLQPLFKSSQTNVNELQAYSFGIRL